jgi:hypothetical protein
MEPYRKTKDQFERESVSSVDGSGSYGLSPKAFGETFHDDKSYNTKQGHVARQLGKYKAVKVKYAGH